MNQGKGFILTTQVRELSGHSCIELWVSSDSGPIQLTVPSQESVFFVLQKDVAQAEQLIRQHHLACRVTPLSLRDFQDHPVSACYCKNIKTSQQVTALFQQADITVLESDIRLTERYLMERFIRGGIAFSGNQLTTERYQKYSQVKCKKADYHPTLSSVSLDIECSEKGILYSVGLASAMDSRVIMIGNEQPAETAIQWVDDEKALLHALIEWFERYDPDLILGWNVIDFDFRLLCQRAEWHQVRFALGRGRQNAYFRRSSQNQQGYISIPGRVVLDGISALKTATYQFRSWSLEYVSQELLGEGKAIHNVYDRMDEINHMFRKDKPSLAKYNLQDCVLVNKIFAHTHLIEFLIERTKLTGLDLDRIGGSVAAFTNIYLPQLHRAGYVAPNLIPENWQASPGGYVMDSIPGLYDSVLVLDFKSLYPSIIRSFLIDPLGLIEGLKLEQGKRPDQAIAGFRGGQFHREKHFLPRMIEELWAARDIAKKNDELAFSQAIKIIMNSFYGVLGSSGCRFFDVRLASSITMRGHEIMKQTKTLIEQQGYQVIYGDTDSTFVSLKASLSQQEANEIGKHLATYINQWWARHLDNEYHLTSCLELEYETHYRRFLMPTIRGAETGSKKRYAGLTGEGSNEHIIFKGLESARTDWTALSQRFQKELYEIIFHGDNPEEYIRRYVDATLAGEYDADLVYQKRLRRKLSDYQKNVPPQVRAARLADEINAKTGRSLQYQNKGVIQYLITTNGPEPKEYLQSPVDYQHYIDKQLKPVADAILPFIGLDFDALNAPQMGLF
ncbi:DNA polymerase II [Vibrio albus]|uniref:DNA polymerase n=1 Tax=Vibrio albus TaxID=2200953 RepID=A0A2U3BBA4_9VIBR|nr:DNA polymerase II [Vibrio albus]PWI34070.1 DNA polymerase II [Vibrio albus]